MTFASALNRDLLPTKYNKVQKKQVIEDKQQSREWI
jgi:hypothetical protein